MNLFAHERFSNNNNNTFSNSMSTLPVHENDQLGSRYGRPSTPTQSFRKDEKGLKRSNTRDSIVDSVPDTLRNHFIAMVGEFVGTLLFLFFALSGTQTANNINTSSGMTIAEAGSNPQQLLYIALCFGFSLAVNAWTFFRISGGLFNPAVTVGLVFIGAVDWVRGVLLFITQILAGMAAAGLVSCLFPGPLNVGTTLTADTSVVQGFFIELILTAQLVFTIFMLAAEKHKGTFMAPVGIGLSLFIAELTGVHYTGGSLNPARSFGPCVVDLSFPSIHWIYWAGPIAGAFVAAGLYHLFRFLDYETANPGQDDAEVDEKPRSPRRLSQRSSFRRDSIITSQHPQPTFWAGETAIDVAAGAMTGGCAACKSRSILDSASPTLREGAFPYSPRARDFSSPSSTHTRSEWMATRADSSRVE